MKKFSRKVRSFLWVLVAVFIINAAGPVHAVAQPKRDTRAVELEQKMSHFKKLIKDLEETRDLYRKRKEGKASPEELEKLAVRLKTIKKAIYITTITLLAVIATALGVFMVHKTYRWITEPTFEKLEQQKWEEQKKKWEEEDREWEEKKKKMAEEADVREKGRSEALAKLAEFSRKPPGAGQDPKWIAKKAEEVKQATEQAKQLAEEAERAVSTVQAAVKIGEAQEALLEALLQRLDIREELQRAQLHLNQEEDDQLLLTVEAVLHEATNLYERASEAMERAEAAATGTVESTVREPYKALRGLIGEDDKLKKIFKELPKRGDIRWWHVLGFDKMPNKADARKAYKFRVLEVHPDKNLDKFEAYSEIIKYVIKAFGKSQK